MIEVMVVVAIIVIAGAATSIIGFDAIGRSNAHTERDAVVSVLMTARARAQSNVNQSAHGVHVGSTAYTLFQGATYTAGNPTNRDYPRDAGMTLSGATDIVFSQLTGDVSAPGTVTITAGAQSASVTVSNRGRIEW